MASVRSAVHDTKKIRKLSSKKMFLSFCDNIIKFSVLYEPNYVSDMNSTYPTFI